MNPVLYKADEKSFRTFGLGEISDAYKVLVTRERNGNYDLYMKYPVNGQFASIFKEEMKIKADAGRRTKWQTFEINRIVKDSNEHIEVYARHISMRTSDLALNPVVKMSQVDANTALTIWRDNLIGDDVFDVRSDIDTLGNIYWEIDKVGSARKALGGVSGSILDVYGGEYEFDNNLIYLHNQMGRKAPTVLEYGRNLLGVEEERLLDGNYTSIYPFARYTPTSEGEGGNSEEILVTLPEHIRDGPYLNLYAQRRISLVDFSGKFDEKNPPTVEKLRDFADSYIKTNRIGAPKVSTDVSYVDLSQTLDYADFAVMEEVELCDIIPLYYPQFGITTTTEKVVKIVYDVYRDSNDEITLGTIGQSLSSSMTAGIADRLAVVEEKQASFESTLPKYLVNASGNRVWDETPDEDVEHKIGDIWFNKNGLYDQMYVWNGNMWEKRLDTEDLVVDIDEFKNEIEKIQKEIDLSIPNFDTIIERLSRVEQSNNVTAEMIGYDGLTRYNKNRADGQTTREQEFGAGNIEIMHNGDGFEAGQTYTVSFSAECVPLVKKQVTVKSNQRMPLTVNFSHVYSKLDNMSTEIAKDEKQAEIELWGAKYDAVVTSDWYKTQTVRVDASETDTVNLELEYREIADGDQIGDYWIGYWDENPEFVLFGGGNE